MTGWNQIWALMLALSTALTGLSGCLEAPAEPDPTPPTAEVRLEEKNDRATVDYTNAAEGYVRVCFTGETEKRLKVQVVGPATTYPYDLPRGEWVTYPLTDGEGTYRVSVYENTEGSSYRAVLTASVEAAFSSPQAPFLTSNQYVDYDSAPQAVARAGQLTQGITDPGEQAEAVFRFVAETLSYDEEAAGTVQSGYLPQLDQVLEKGKGICLDYAALMAGMLRSQGIPCKLVVGYANNTYHAWVEVWSQSGQEWQRMDPTFASSGVEVGKLRYTQRYVY